jgi:hypothetical protein
MAQRWIFAQPPPRIGNGQIRVPAALPQVKTTHTTGQVAWYAPKPVWMLHTRGERFPLLNIDRRSFSPQFSRSTLFLARQSPPVGQGLLIHEVYRSHTTTHHSPVQLLWTSDQLVADTSILTTQHSQQTSMLLERIRTYNLSRQAAADLRLRPRG